MIPKDVEVHEFYTRDYFIYHPDGNTETAKVYMVALGKLIPAHQRQIFKPKPGHPGYNTLSGSIGFMNIKRDIEFIPKEGAPPYNPHNNPHLQHEYIDNEHAEALVIMDIGIEPEYQCQGYARFLKQRAEKIARKWGLRVIVASTIESDIMRDFNVRLGYQLYERGRYAVKRLKF